MEKLVVPCEVYSRVVGYFRPVNSWNKGKKQEFNERVAFTEEHSLNAETNEVETSLVSSSPISSYKLFTFPNCDTCEQVKSFLKEKEFPGEIIDLKTPEGNKQFRGYYTNKAIKDNIKRMEDGTLKLPIVMFMKDKNIVSTVQSLEEAKQILN